MAQIIPFPFHKIKNKNNHFTEKHILHMIKNIRENYPPSLWNTIYQLSKKGHLNEYLNGDGDAKKLNRSYLFYYFIN